MAATRNPRRRTELGLLVLAGLIIGSAYTLASLGRTASIPAGIGPFLGAVLVLFIGAHVAVRRWACQADSMFVPIAVLLNGLGYVLIARLNDHLASRQAAWTAVGIGAFIATLAVIRRVRELERVRYTIGLAGVLLLLVPLVPGIGVSINGSRIWMRLGPISLQPGEFAKIALAIFFAAYLTERRELLRTSTRKLGPLMTPDPKDLAPVLVAWGFSLVVIVFEKDLGSALLFFVLFMSMLWIASERLSYLAIGLGLFSIGSYGSWLAFSHVQTRVSMWLNPWSDPTHKGFQIIQSTYAFAWGGIGGTGLGLGLAKSLPLKESDFIFAIIGEELGLFGATAVLIAFLVLIGSGLRVAIALNDPFSKLLAAGLTTLLGFQSFLIMGGVTRLLPLTGVTLPFVSYGGSSLVSNWIVMALLVRLSHEAATQRDGELVGSEATTVLSVAS